MLKQIKCGIVRMSSALGNVKRDLLSTRKNS